MRIISWACVLLIQGVPGPFHFGRQEGERIMRRREKQILDVQDAARIIGCHPEVLRLKVREGLVKPIDDSPPFYFRRAVIETLPKCRMGRPLGSRNKNPKKGGDR
jgi:hypothetical protein